LMNSSFIVESKVGHQTFHKPQLHLYIFGVWLKYVSCGHNWPLIGFLIG
jgi:hypothetical protein